MPNVTRSFSPDELRVIISTPNTQMFSVVQEFHRLVKSEMDRYSARPDFGSDDLRHARLVGSYHAHKGAGKEYVNRWRMSLRWEDLAWIDRYATRGEWGNLEDRRLTPRWDQLIFATVDYSVLERSGISVRMGAPTTEPRPRPSVEQASVWSDLGEKWAMPKDFDVLSRAYDEALVIVERIRLRGYLEAAYLPSTVACWLARRWPSWLLPAVLVVRIANLMDRDGKILRRWLRLDQRDTEND